MNQFTKRQWAVFFSCFIAYTAAYITRTNLSPAIPAIAKELSLSDAQTGLLATVFAIPYAAGQLINGYFADRASARAMILGGLLGSSVVNILFAQARLYPLLLALWFFNGCFQSMLWTPIVRTLAVRFYGKARDGAVFGVSITLILGYVIAWSLTGAVTALLSWRIAFTISGVITAMLAVLSFSLLGGMPQSERRASQPDKPQGSHEPPMPLGDILVKTGLIYVLACSVLNGYVRDAIMTWAPKMLMDTQGINMESALGAMLIIPMVNLLGILFGRKIHRWVDGSVHMAISILMGLCGVFALLLTAFYQLHPALCAFLLGMCSSVAYGINPLLTSILPMDYQNTGRIALVAGMIDASIYVGSALTGVLSGAMHDAYGWMSVFLSWIFLSVIGFFLMLVANRARQRFPM